MKVDINETAIDDLNERITRLLSLQLNECGEFNESYYYNTAVTIACTLERLGLIDDALSTIENAKKEVIALKNGTHYWVLLIKDAEDKDANTFLTTPTYYHSEKEAIRAFLKHVDSDNATGALLLECKDGEEVEIGSYDW